LGEQLLALENGHFHFFPRLLANKYPRPIIQWLAAAAISVFLDSFHS
jgi:hypothetical protein